MTKTKHFLDLTEADDGPRLWVESIGLTKDLQNWRSVDHVMPHVGPPTDLSKWFAVHPNAYDTFRDHYHEWLSNLPCRYALRQLASSALKANFTLVHAGDDPEHNCAAALREFIAEFEACCPC